MHIHLRLAEPYWRSVGSRELELDLSPGSRVRDLLEQLQDRHPDFSRELKECPPHIFIGDEEGTWETPLAEASRVHLVWPIAGG